MTDATTARGSERPGDRESPDIVEVRNGREAAVSPAIVDTFRVLGLDSADARARLRGLVAPGVVDVGGQGDQQRIDTGNGTLTITDSHHA